MVERDHWWPVALADDVGAAPVPVTLLDEPLVLWRDGAEEIVRVNAPGTYVIVPQGVWYTVRPHAPTG